MANQTQLWAGLGNPEPGQARHRHNVGFMAIDAIAATYRFSPWRQRFKGLFAEGTVGGSKILALKPLTNMNGSGESIQPALAFYKLRPEALVVLHDELDLALGRVRVKRGGGAAGHNGLRSTDRMLATPDYWRIRLGISHPGAKERVIGHVLGDFAKPDQPLLAAMLDAVARAAPLFADQLTQTGAEAFMTRVALLTQEAG